MRTQEWKASILVLLMWGVLSATSVAAADKQKAAVQQAQSQYARGAANAVADFASGRPGWYFHAYSNMPNGPDDPVLARERDLFVTVMQERGVKPMSSNPGCDPSSTLPQFAAGYNSVADGLLRAQFGSAFMDEIHKEVARRMKADSSNG